MTRNFALTIYSAGAGSRTNVCKASFFGAALLVLLLGLSMVQDEQDKWTAIFKFIDILNEIVSRL
jgi:hypothetical protein